VRIAREVTLFLVATQFLTRLPVPRLRDFEPLWLTQSARYFPLVGALVGLLNVAVWWVCRHWFAPSISVGLMLAASLLITGAFHEDGFADACDGFGGGSTPERVLAIMTEVDDARRLARCSASVGRDCGACDEPLVCDWSHLASRLRA
jgi:adenosylcobinamide-GDP ribazoletransferase